MQCKGLLSRVIIKAVGFNEPGSVLENNVHRNPADLPFIVAYHAELYFQTLEVKTNDLIVSANHDS